MKAMLLAAGRGERLRPVTDYMPKALLPVAGQALIVHHLLNLAAAGIEDIVINVSYKAEQIQQTLGDGSCYGVRISYSVEPVMLNTGGGVVQALPLLGTEPFILLSADIYTAYPLEKLLKPLTGLAHLIMVDNPLYHPTGDFALQYGLLTVDGSECLTYANIGVYHPQLFQAAPQAPFPLVQLLKPAIAQGQVSAERYTGTWHNVGTVADWQHLQNNLKQTAAKEEHSN